MKLGATDISKVYLGSTEVSKAYLGDVLVHGSDVPLPYDAEVEWLQSDGTAFINTHIFSAGNIRIKVHAIDYFGGSYGGKWLFGARNGANNKMFGLFINGNTGSVHFAYNNGMLTYDNYSTYPSTCDIEVNNGTVKIGTTSHSYTKATFTGSYGVCLFGLNNAGNVIVSTTKIGAVYITNGTTTLDLIPVRKNGVGYMYDKISGQLIGNSYGSGAFTYGNDVTT